MRWYRMVSQSKTIPYEVGPWIYVYWEGDEHSFRSFAGGAVGRYRTVERLGPERPSNLAERPFMTWPYGGKQAMVMYRRIVELAASLLFLGLLLYYIARAIRGF